MPQAQEIQSSIAKGHLYVIRVLEGAVAQQAALFDQFRELLQGNVGRTLFGAGIAFPHDSPSLNDLGTRSARLDAAARSALGRDAFEAIRPSLGRVAGKTSAFAKVAPRASMR